MKVRFILPNNNGGDPRYDETLELPAVPMPGETVGIQPEGDEMAVGDRCALYWCEYLRWYVIRGEVTVECWLTDDHNMGHRVGPATVSDLQRLPQASFP